MAFTVHCAMVVSLQRQPGGQLQTLTIHAGLAIHRLPQLNLPPRRRSSKLMTPAESGAAWEKD